MRCPTLHDLPPPPPGKTGWPWTEESTQAPELTPSGEAWPRISIVTPSYNQGAFLEETIRSVLLQGYPDLEYIIIDGGSTDSSVQIIQKYAKWISYWVSHADRGQTDAINRGFLRCTGKVVAWLNSDDMYYSGILEYVGQKYLDSESPTRFWLISSIDWIDVESGTKYVGIQECWNSLDDWVSGKASFNQQGTFWGREVIATAGPLREGMHFGFDTEYVTRLIYLGYQFACANDIVAACYRQHAECKWKKGLMPFQYEWLHIRIYYLRAGGEKHKSDTRQLTHNLAFFELRFSQDSKKPKTERLRWIVKAYIHSPWRLTWDRVFWGSLARVILPGFQAWREGD